MYYITGGIAIIIFGVLCYNIGLKVGAKRAYDDFLQMLDDRKNNRM